MNGAFISALRSLIKRPDSLENDPGEQKRQKVASVLQNQNSPNTVFSKNKQIVCTYILCMLFLYKQVDRHDFALPKD